MSAGNLRSETTTRTDPDEQRLDRRDVDEFIGLCRAICADGDLKDDELKTAIAWTKRSGRIECLPLVGEIQAALKGMPSKPSDEDRRAMLALLGRLTGEMKDGKLSPATLPLDDPMPELKFDGRTYCFTGTFDFGTRAACQNAVLRRGGAIRGKITLSTDVLVIGSRATDAWLHSSYGQKISTAVRWKKDGKKIVIVSEEHWANHIRNTPPTLSLGPDYIDFGNDPIGMAMDLAEHGEITRAQFEEVVGDEVPFSDAASGAHPGDTRGKRSSADGARAAHAANFGSKADPRGSTLVNLKSILYWLVIIALFGLAAIWISAGLRNMADRHQNPTTVGMETGGTN